MTGIYSSVKEETTVRWSNNNRTIAITVMMAGVPGENRRNFILRMNRLPCSV